MIHGATTRLASHQRTVIDTSTRSESQPQAGTLVNGPPVSGRAGPGRPFCAKPSSSSRIPSSCANGVPGSTPTSAAASATSLATASATTGPPAASSSAAAYCSATRPTSCSRSTYVRAASLIARCVASLAARSSSEVANAGISSSSTGTLRATSSGNSENQPRSLTTSGHPSESARIALPDVSPIVGARSETHASQAAISVHKRCSST